MQDNQWLKIFYWIAAFISIANGLWMLFAPQSWHDSFPMQLADFGAYNARLVQELGISFITIGLLFGWCARHMQQRQAIHWIITTFFVAIAILNIVDLTTGKLGAEHWTLDAPFVFLPALIMIFIALPWQQWLRPKKESGEVKWFNANKGFGFITRSNGDDVFVHYRSIRGRGRRSLREGQQVEFRLTTGDKGLQAEDVVKVGR